MSAISTLREDLRFALRLHARRLGTTVAIVASLALGVGINSALFSLVDVLLLRPAQGLSKPRELFEVSYHDRRSRGTYPSSYSQFRHMGASCRDCGALAVYSHEELALAHAGYTDRVRAHVVSSSYFRTLGARAAIGRFPATPGDRPHGAELEIVVGHAFWRSRLAADSSAVGRGVLLNGTPATIVGVATPGFTGPWAGEAVDAWIPLSALPQLDATQADVLDDPRSHSFSIVGRLVPGGSTDRVQAAALAVWRSATRDGDREPEPRTEVHRLSDGRAGRDAESVAPAFAVMSAVGAIVLVLTCVNLGNLLLVRGALREHEFGIRVALGGTRSRLLAQLGTEYAVLAIAGAVTGVLVGWWISLAALRLAGAPGTIAVALQGREIVFALGASFVTTFAFGAAPLARSAFVDVARAMRGRGVNPGGRRGARFRRLLVAAQLTLAAALLGAAVLFLRGFVEARRLDLGFAPDPSVVAIRADAGLVGLDDARARRFYYALVARIEGTPSVVSVALADRLPLDGRLLSANVEVLGRSTRDAVTASQSATIDRSLVSSRYFGTMGVRIIRGRGFEESDGSLAPPVVIVNETLARRYWPGQDPVGEHLSLGSALTMTVVGVVADGKYGTLEESPRPYAFMPLQQNEAFRRELVVLVRARSSAAASAAAAEVRRAAAALEPTVPVFEAIALSQHAAAAVATRRRASWLVGSLALVALVIAVTGVYAMSAHAVLARTREVGIRIALGARAQDIVSLFVRDTVRLAIWSVASGSALALVPAIALRSFLLGITIGDGLILCAVSLTLAVLALTAALVPARRAAAVDPTHSLRAD